MTVSAVVSNPKMMVMANVTRYYRGDDDLGDALVVVMAVAITTMAVVRMMMVS